MSQLQEFSADLIKDKEFSFLVTSYALKIYRYNDAHQEDQKSALESASHTFTQLKFHCLRFSLINSEICDGELHNMIMKWFNDNVLSQNKNICEDFLENHNKNNIVKNYVGSIPKVPNSELVSGYNFDIGIGT